MFTLEILVIYLESLAMAHKDDKSLGKNVHWVEMFVSDCAYNVVNICVLVLQAHKHNALKWSVILRE